MAFRNVAYFATNNGTNIADCGCFKAPDGSQFFDIVCIFAANIDGTANDATLSFNQGVQTVLGGGQVATLQGLGIKVLLTVLGNHETAGWSNFTEQSAADAFAGQLADAVNKYGLDGIDIDDEYSTGPTNVDSLVMVTTALRQALPDTAIITKALWSDIEYFDVNYDGRTLAENLTYGAEMSYGGTPYGDRLAPYVQRGMAMGDLALGVSADGGEDGEAAGSYVKENGVGGIMVFDVTSAKVDFLNSVSQGLYGGDVVVDPDCFGN